MIIYKFVLKNHYRSIDPFLLIVCPFPLSLRLFLLHNFMEYCMSNHWVYVCKQQATKKNYKFTIIYKTIFKKAAMIGLLSLDGKHGCIKEVKDWWGNDEKWIPLDLRTFRRKKEHKNSVCQCISPQTKIGQLQNPMISLINKLKLPTNFSFKHR